MAAGVIDAIRADPDWRGGDYPTSRELADRRRDALPDASNPVKRQEAARPRRRTRPWTSSRGLAGDGRQRRALRAGELARYDPGPGLEKIKAPLLAINFADDLINPPELGILKSRGPAGGAGRGGASIREASRRWATAPHPGRRLEGHLVALLERSGQ